MKTERPILFSTPMVKSLLNETKTMTRRIMKVQADDRGYILSRDNSLEDYHGRRFFFPYGKISDILWVKETWTQNGLEYYRYKADFKPEDWDEMTFKGKSVPDKFRGKWKPSLFMPKSAARIFLEITDIRVERLQSISEQDAINEGIEPCGTHGYKNYLSKTEMLCKLNPIESFKTLWQSINGIESWDKNPFVWVIEFKRIK